jgi:hypothetical protein
MPYGNYAAVGKEDLLREFILRDALFLLGNRVWPSADATAPLATKPPVKAIVIACNTATAYGLDDLRRALDEWGLPVLVVGVVEAGANSVIDLLPHDGEAGAIAVLATTGTCSSGAYPRAIARIAGQRGLRQPEVIQRSSALRRQAARRITAVRPSTTPWHDSIPRSPTSMAFRPTACWGTSSRPRPGNSIRWRTTFVTMSRRWSKNTVAAAASGQSVT